MNRRVLFFVNSPRFFLSHRASLARFLKHRGYTVGVATPRESGVEAAIEEDFEYFEVSLDRWKAGIFGELRALFSISCIIRKFHPDVLHNVTIKPVIYGSIVGRVLRVPVIVNAVSGLGVVFISSGVLASLRRIAVTLLYRIALRSSRVFAIFQNEDDRATFLALGAITKEHTVIIRGSGVDLCRFTPSPFSEGPPVVVMLSRLLKEKGVREFVEAAKILSDKGINAIFRLFGDSDFKNPAAIDEKALNTWRSAGHVEFLGHISDSATAYRQAHIACLPSYREGLPLALIEAAAAGLPIVSCDVPGCREIAIHNENAILVPPKDSKALADALEQLIINNDLRLRFGKKGRALVETGGFSQEEVWERTASFYEGILSSSRPKHTSKA